MGQGKTYVAHNYAQPTTAAFVPVTTGTAIKTLLQVATPASQSLTIVAWGIDFDGSAAGAPIKVELIDTDVAATVTAHGASGLVKIGGPNDEASVMTLSTTGTGFTASAEGTVGATSRLISARQVAPNGGYEREYSLGREPRIAVSRFLRIRVHAPVAVNANCWLMWEE